MDLSTSLSRLLRWVSLRVRAQRALEASVTLGLAGAGVAAFALALAKIGMIDDEAATRLLVVAALVPLIGALAGALRAVPKLMSARLLDRSHPTEGRIAAAVELAASPNEEQLAWTRAALDDARERASDLRAAKAAPLRAPRDLGPLMALLAVIAVLAALEVPRRIEVRPAIARGITPVLLHQDDLDAYRDRVRDVLEEPELPEIVREQAEAFNRVLEDLAAERIDQQEAMRRLAELEARTGDHHAADPALVREELSEMGRALGRSDLARSLADAMQRGDAAAAEIAARELADRLRQQDRPSRRELERLRQALEEAAREREQSELAEDQEGEERLLRRDREGEAGAEQEERLLEQRRRELDRLRREHEQQAEARRQLDRLQRELEQAAEDLARELGQPEQASEDMDDAAEELNRMAREQMTEQEMRELAQQMRELRELIRRQRQSGGGQSGSQSGGQSGEGRMQRFVLRAQGQGDGMRIGVRGPGSGQGQGGSPQGQGSEAQGGQSGSPTGQGAGGEGSGEGEAGQEPMLVLGEGGDAIIELPGLGQQGGGGQGDQLGPSGEGGEEQGGGAGSDPGPPIDGDPTRLGGSSRTVQVQGQASRGPSRSEVIRGAAQQGFASRDYQRVYSDYASHAEEALERDEVPPGYRYYVQRYFQLIRPREGGQEPETR